MINKVILVGNVGADPEIRTFEDGSKVARINIATTERVYNHKTQERSERTDWHRLTVWRGLATVAEQYVRKGSQLYIEGKIRNSEWTDANGQKRFGVEILVDVMQMLGRRDQSQQVQPLQPREYNEAPQGMSPQGMSPQGMTSPSYSAPQSNATQYESTPAEIDDLPF